VLNTKLPSLLPLPTVVMVVSLMPRMHMQPLPDLWQLNSEGLVVLQTFGQVGNDRAKIVF
jgi:hypothetical protein